MISKFVRREYEMRSIEQVAISDLSDDLTARVPDVWRKVLEVEPSAAAEVIADVWSQYCPGMPRVSEFIRKELLDVRLATRPKPYHYVRAYTSGAPDQEWLAKRDLVLVYILNGPTESRPYQLWYGNLPYSEDVPTWFGSAATAYGDIPTKFHDGFMTIDFISGILPLGDVHSLADRWIRYTDPELEEFQVVRGENDSSPVPQDQWPEFDSVMVLAENGTEEAWGVEAGTRDGSGWGGESDWVYRTENLSTSIETMIGYVTGAIQNGRF